jgi:hypothetical protein
MLKAKLGLSFFLLLLSFSMTLGQGQNNLTKDFVPDANTAIKIAEAVWLPIYGEAIYKHKPFIADFDDSKKVWIVFGTTPEGKRGGNYFARIQKSDGKILEILKQK